MPLVLNQSSYKLAVSLLYMKPARRFSLHNIKFFTHQVASLSVSLQRLCEDVRQLKKVGYQHNASKSRRTDVDLCNLSVVGI